MGSIETELPEQAAAILDLLLATFPTFRFTRASSVFTRRSTVWPCPMNSPATTPE